MRRRAGTAVHANGWWLVPIAGAEVAANAAVHDLAESFVEPLASGVVLDANLLFAAFPLSSSRKLKHSAGLAGGLGLVAARVVERGNRRHDSEHVLVLRAQAGTIEALFGDPAPPAETRAQICVALARQLADTLDPRRLGKAPGIAPSIWRIDQVVEILREYPRLDDETDLLACRLGSRCGARAIYVYLYGADPSKLYFDLEDPRSGSEEWDGAVARGSVSTLDRLGSVAREWLDKGGLYTGPPGIPGAG